MAGNTQPPQTPPAAVTVDIFGQQYHLAGNDPAHLHALAARVDAIMRAVAASGRSTNAERVAVLTALNLADELTRLESVGGMNVAEGSAREANLRKLLDLLLIEETRQA